MVAKQTNACFVCMLTVGAQKPKHNKSGVPAVRRRTKHVTLGQNERIHKAVRHGFPFLYREDATNTRKSHSEPNKLTQRQRICQQDGVRGLVYGKQRAASTVLWGMRSAI